jgi:hypothetical protein
MELFIASLHTQKLYVFQNNKCILKSMQFINSKHYTECFILKQYNFILKKYVVEFNQYL